MRQFVTAVTAVGEQTGYSRKAAAGEF